jgi:heme-degrading monooxygenase HmoA
MPIITVFRSRLRDDVHERYEAVAAEMDRMVRTQPGFIDQKTYLADDGERVTIVRFANEMSQRMWAMHPAHVGAQRRGRDEFYASYEISISEEITSRRFDATA